MSVNVAHSDPLGAHGEGFLGFSEPEINSSNSTAHLTEQLITILASTRDQTLVILEQMGEDGELPRSILELATIGENAYEDALYYYSECDWSSAEDSAMESLGLYGDAMGLSLDIQSENKDEDSQKEEMIEVPVSLERTRSFFDKVLQLSEKLEQNGINITDVNSHLEDASELISLAESHLEKGENPEAEEEKVLSEGILTEALDCLEELSGNMKTEKASKFFERAGGQLGRLKIRINETLTFSQVNSTDISVANTALQGAKNKSHSLVDIVESGDLDTSMEEYEEVLDEKEEAFNVVEKVNAKLAKKIKKIDKLETENEYLEEKKERLENKGVDASHVKEKLKKVKGELEDEEASLNEGNAPGNSKKVKDKLEDEEASLNEGNAPGNSKNSEKPKKSNKKKD